MTNLAAEGIKNVVAVYGTLRYGDRANYLMEGCKYLGKDTVSGKLYDLGAYPGAKLGSDNVSENIVVDLYSVPSPGVLAGLDKYEGYYVDDPDSSLYVRKEVLTNEGCLSVWCYEYVHEINEDWRIENGDWFVAEETQ